MTGFAYSFACHLAMCEAPIDLNLADFWQLDDLTVIAHNLIEAASSRPQWKSWIVDRGRPDRLWCRTFVGREKAAREPVE
jgi:hypothetical protein